MKMIQLLSRNKEDLDRVCRSARRSGIIASYSEPRDVDEDGSRWLVKAMILKDREGLEEYLKKFFIGRVTIV